MSKEPKSKKIKKVVPLQTKIMSALRKVWRYSELKKEAISRAKDLSNPKHIICAGCKQSIHEKLISVDHIDPIITEIGFTDWNNVIKRMLYCPVENLAALCESCHKAKTKQESAARAEHKRSLKPPKPPKIPKRKASTILW